MSEFTAEGHTWTRDFSRWWFHVTMPEHTGIEGDHYILPSYWAGTDIGPSKLTLRRIYLELWQWEKRKVLDMGFLMFDHPELLFKPNIAVAQQIEWMELDKYINENKTSLANIGLYGIEGAIQKPNLPPMSMLLEHVLKTARVTDDPEDEIVNVEWENFNHMLDGRTSFVWIPDVLSKPFMDLGLFIHTGTQNLVQVEAKTEAGKQWLVTRYVEKEHSEETKSEN